MRVRCFAAADLVEALYRGMADNSVARIIDSLLRADLAMRRAGLRPSRPDRQPAAVPVRGRRLRASLPPHRQPLVVRGFGGVLGVPLVIPLAVLTFLGGFVALVGATVAGLVAASWPW